MLTAKLAICSRMLAALLFDGSCLSLCAALLTATQWIPNAADRVVHKATTQTWTTEATAIIATAVLTVT